MRKLYKLAEVKIRYSTRIPKQERIVITSSQQAYEVFMSNWDQNTIELYEEFKILLLNRANEVLGIYTVSKGGIAGTVVDAKIVFSVAIKCLASSIILAHNHPSGNLRPSHQDIELTKKLKKVGETLDIQVLDHLIVTKEGYHAMEYE